MASLMVQLIPSASRIKRKGESGSPCLMPREGEKGFEGMPLMRMENNVEEVILTVQETHSGSKLKARREDIK